MREGRWRTWEPARRSRRRPLRRDARDRRARSDRRRRRPPRRRLRDGGDRQLAALRHAARGAARARRLRLAALPAHAGHAAPDRHRGAAAHEAERATSSTPRAAASSTRSRCGWRCSRARSPAPRSTSPIPSRCPPATRCWRRRTCSSSPTSARPPCAPASGWRRWRSRTCSPPSPGARCRTRSDRQLRVAVVDLGTNSTRLLIADVRGRARCASSSATPWSPASATASTHRPARRGRAGAGARHARGRTPEPIERHGCERRVAVLTSAVRDAANGGRVHGHGARALRPRRAHDRAATRRRG